MPSVCPPGATHVDSFITADGTAWLACEDLQTPAGGLTLVPSAGAPLHIPKTYEPYWQGSAADAEYFLGLDRAEVLAAKWDMLGAELLRRGDPTFACVRRRGGPTFARVRRALPPIRRSGGDGGAGPQCNVYAAGGGVRTFVGSRSASVDATFSDHAEDCSANGFPSVQSYVINLTSVAMDEPTITDFSSYLNFTAIADGLVGGHLPAAAFYFPILRQNFSTFGGSRYWTMIAAPVPDMRGGREQSVWFRFQQLRCARADLGPPCDLHGPPQYYDTYWFSSSPIPSSRWVRPELRANASGFYSNLLELHRWWGAELAAEGIVDLSLPETAQTNGTWLRDQAVHSVVRSMISRDDTWHPRYGVLPGYGITLQDGFQDTFTATATAALEMGAMAYARGVIDNWLRYYVRDNGMVSYRAEELPQSGRMLTTLALYYRRPPSPPSSPPPSLAPPLRYAPLHCAQLLCRC